jgi:hypothetical protein
MSKLWRERLAGKITALIPEGYTFDPDASTGGGCRAMWIQSDDGRSVEITDGDADLPFTDPDMRDVVFSYFNDGEPDGELILETHQGNEPSDNFWEGSEVALKAWIDGDPYREI